MKGQIKKTDYGWIVVWSHPMEYREPEHELPLHPKDIELFSQFEKIFDNFEARVLSSPEVDFEINMWSDDAVPKQYAKLKTTMLNDKQQKTQSSVEWLVTQYEIKFGVSITKVMVDEIALAKQKFEQEIIDAWVASAQYGVTEEYLKINSGESKIGKIYYDNKYGK